VRDVVTVPCQASVEVLRSLPTCVKSAITQQRHAKLVQLVSKASAFPCLLGWSTASPGMLADSGNDANHGLGDDDDDDDDDDDASDDSGGETGRGRFVHAARGVRGVFQAYLQARADSALPAPSRCAACACVWLCFWLEFFEVESCQCAPRARPRPR